MSKKAIFEVATLADAVAKAFRVAPTKGAAYDKASGIMIELNPFDLVEPVVIKSTNLEVTYRQHVSCLEQGDEPASWRVHARLLHDLMSQMPMGMGNTVLLQQITGSKADGYLYFVCGKMKAKLQLIVSEFPNIVRYDPDELVAVRDLSRRLAQVAWATDAKALNILAGVHLNGKQLIATDKNAAVVVPCEVPISRPVTAPLNEIASLIKNTSEVHMFADDTHMWVSPDQWTQTTCTLHAGDYPDVPKLLEGFEKRFTGKLIAECETLKAAIDRSLVLVKSERYPRTTVEIGEGTMKLTVEVPGVGKIADEIDIQGGQPPGAEPFIFLFAPDYLKRAVEASGRQTIELRYGPSPLSPLLLCDDNDYKVIMMPMQPTVNNPAP